MNTEFKGLCKDKFDGMKSCVKLQCWLDLASLTNLSATLVYYRQQALVVEAKSFTWWW